MSDEFIILSDCFMLSDFFILSDDIFLSDLSILSDILSFDMLDDINVLSDILSFFMSFPAPFEQAQSMAAQTNPVVKRIIFFILRPPFIIS
ncbi:Uncharacterised protein [Chlamydia trachomatis]|nr:Uncharacterised protein [Chlamydia trachomatis]